MGRLPSAGRPVHAGVPAGAPGGEARRARWRSTARPVEKHGAPSGEASGQRPATVGGVRIVSLLPSTTEILFALGAGDQIVGVTFECDYPPEARQRRIVSTSTLPPGLPPAEVDRLVTERMRAGEDLYHLDRGALSGLEPDLVVTQDLCAVCAVDVSEVSDALAYLGCRAEVLTIDPHRLAEVLESITTLGRADRHQRPRHGVGLRAVRPAGGGTPPSGSPGGPGHARWCWSGPDHLRPRSLGTRDGHRRRRRVRPR